MENMENNNGQSYRRTRTLHYLAITLDGYWASMIEREPPIELGKVNLGRPLSPYINKTLFDNCEQMFNSLYGW